MAFTFSRGALGAAALLACLSSQAVAHVSFEVARAPANSAYKAVLRVTHGCAGQATHTVRVQVPEGVIDVKPMPKAGWALSTAKSPYAKPVDLHGTPVTEGVREIVWSGGSLADEHYDEFVFRGRLTGELAGKTIAFPVVLECATAAERWIEIAQPGQDPHALNYPAPTVSVTAAAAAAASPATYRAGAITVEQPWSRATPGGAKVAGGYMRITNTGSEPDRLIGGTFTASGRVEFHEMSIGTDNVMRMRALEKGLEIKPGESVELKPGGHHHAMFLDLQRPLKEGESLTGTLRFEKAGSIEVTYVVRGIGAQGATAGDHSNH